MRFLQWVAAIKMAAQYWNLKRKVARFKDDLVTALAIKIKAGQKIEPIDFGHGTALLVYRDERQLFIPESRAIINGQARLLEIKPYPNELFGCYEWMPNAMMYPIIEKVGMQADGICCINALTKAWMLSYVENRKDADPYRTRTFAHLVVRSILLHEYGHAIRAQQDDSPFQENPNGVFVMDDREECYADIIAACNAGLFGIMLYLFQMDIILRLMYLCNYIPDPISALASIRTRIRPLIVLTLGDVNVRAVNEIIELWSNTVSKSLSEHARELNELACFLVSGSTNLITGVYGTLADAICKTWPKDIRDLLDAAIAHDQCLADELAHKENAEAAEKFNAKIAGFKERHPDWFDKPETMKEQQNEESC